MGFAFISCLLKTYLSVLFFSVCMTNIFCTAKKLKKIKFSAVDVSINMNICILKHSSSRVLKVYYLSPFFCLWFLVFSFFEHFVQFLFFLKCNNVGKQSMYVYVGRWFSGLGVCVTLIENIPINVWVLKEFFLILI